MKMANFHLILMLEATKYWFYPDVSDIDMPFFRNDEGVFTPSCH
jgi:hypothetical protein